MKVAGLLLMLSGWIIVLCAVILLPPSASRAAFPICGFGIEILGLFLFLRERTLLPDGWQR